MNSLRKIGILLALCCEMQGVWADDIIITTKEELNTIATNVNAGNNYNGETIKLAHDLDYTNETYVPIGTTTRSFAGIFDGQGHTISGVTLNGSSRQGLFLNVQNGTIRNLTLTNSTIQSSNGVCGGIVAATRGNSTIENCHVTSSVTVGPGNNYVGGVVGSAYAGIITGCTSAANVMTDQVNTWLGGIVGGSYALSESENPNSTTITNCLYYGSSIANSDAATHRGAIIGMMGETNNHVTSLSHNFYSMTQANIMGLGHLASSSGDSDNHDVIGDYGAVRTHIVTSSDDISDMGDADVPYSYDGCTPYDYGVKYGSTYYSHVLALEDNADNSALLSAYKGQIFDVKLRGRRLYKDGNWNTICLPFYVANNSIFGSNDGCTVMELDIINTYNIKGDVTGYAYKTGCEEDKLYLFFHRVYALNAGQPYIVKWTRVDGYNENDPSYDHLNPVFSNVTINNTLAPTTSKDGKVTYQPVYDVFQRDYKDLTVLFLGATSTLYYPSGAGTAKVKPCRAYFQLNGVQMADNSSDMDDDEEFIPSGGGDAKAFVLDIEGDATAVEAMKNCQMKKESEGDRCYTLDGRRIDGNLFQANVSGLKAGIYIVNGKKLFVK